MKMKYVDLSDLCKRRNTFVVGGSGSGLTRFMTIPPEIINELVKEIRLDEKHVPFDFSNRHRTAVGGSGSGLIRCTTIPPEIINELVKELK
ncbi:hypothetical protein [Bacillus pseudomycoides]|uniref:hypothetical protein n=1 Tax=Bacillus pseudomycoides TaxID=64104 RepID=UPI000503F2D8|nr:hypothetical protein [Bacillus pseudomycoides]KFN10986.1 hypothetical protein DJ94_5429 [Bacillus pseudomycoides]MDR4188049.1 hypothetical protein [Bacillus pseudomycoides]MED0855666.1 hypothetical protein [Bacillus pseudomycoides]PEI44636.1 hypothetical protein CN641_16070 [Bacillus pseudomycoides]